MKPPISAGNDPRLETPAAAMGDVAPVVALPRQGLPKPLLLAVAILASVLLFMLLDARRRNAAETLNASPAQTVPTAPPPPLYVPTPLPVPPSAPYYQPAPPISQSVPIPIPMAPRYRPPTFVAPVPIPQPGYEVQTPAYSSPRATASGRGTGDSALVIDTTVVPPQELSPPGNKAGETDKDGSPAILGARSKAGVLANKSTTVPQGTLIPAVLETGFNSTWPGLARAIISRDVRGFDGTRVLIPRGSRVIGEYSSNAAPGQNRAMVNWTSLVRPDGAVIPIGSPSADSVGQGGIRAKVNSHFFQRFTSALLQSVIDVGTSLAGRRSSSSVIVAMPGGVQTSGSLLFPNQPVPTLSIRPGTSITVFVARDLDFTGIER